MMPAKESGKNLAWVFDGIGPVRGVSVRGETIPVPDEAIFESRRNQFETIAGIPMAQPLAAKDGNRGLS
jgi:hypothetical protein